MNEFCLKKEIFDARDQLAKLKWYYRFLINKKRIRLIILLLMNYFAGNNINIYRRMHKTEKKKEEIAMSDQVKELFNTAEEEGLITAEAANALAVVDIGNEIQAALGVAVDDIEASEVVLVTMMPDDSGSIGFENNEQAVCDGHNMVIDALVQSKQLDNILAHTRYLNGHILYPYCPIEQAVKMDEDNYDASQGTPLYDQTVLLLGTVLAKSQDFSDNGVPVRTVTLIITDGADMHSTKANPAMVRSLVNDMLRTEQHIVAALGINDGCTDFRKIFQEMGIRDEWILTPANNEVDIRKAFQIFSQSAVRASQTAVNFSQTAMGGFGN